MSKFQIAVKSHRGMLRANNEDAFAATADLAGENWLLMDTPSEPDQNPVEAFPFPENGLLLAVADGMGGARAGEVAANLAVGTIVESFAKADNHESLREKPRAALFEILMEANRRIVEHSKSDSATRGMGTTIVVALVTPTGAHIAWVGDSRAYLFNAETGLKQLSKDHSYVQELVDEGQITPEIAFYHPENHIITQSLGDPDRDIDPGYAHAPLRAGDQIILCSDGLNSMIYDTEIENLLRETAGISASETAEKLIAAANKAGGNDNVTIAVFQLREGQLAPPAEAAQIEAPAAAAPPIWKPKEPTEEEILEQEEAENKDQLLKTHPKKWTLQMKLAGLTVAALTVTAFVMAWQLNEMTKMVKQETAQKVKNKHFRDSMAQAAAEQKHLAELAQQQDSIRTDSLMKDSIARQLITPPGPDAPKQGPPEKKKATLQLSYNRWDLKNAEKLALELKLENVDAYCVCSKSPYRVWADFDSEEDAVAFKRQFSKNFSRIKYKYSLNPEKFAPPKNKR